jgi:acetoin utilization deacetylase AcuC-like enzyme
MKKAFKLTDPRKAPARQVEFVKHEINKYLARERRKAPQDGADYWDFDCKLGKDLASAADIHVAEINKGIDRVVSENSEQVYVEILAKPGFRAKKTKE